MQPLFIIYHKSRSHETKSRGQCAIQYTLQPFRHLYCKKDERLAVQKKRLISPILRRLGMAEWGNRRAEKFIGQMVSTDYGLRLRQRFFAFSVSCSKRSFMIPIEGQTPAVATKFPSQIPKQAFKPTLGDEQRKRREKRKKRTWGTKQRRGVGAMGMRKGWK